MEAGTHLYGRWRKNRANRQIESVGESGSNLGGGVASYP